MASTSISYGSITITDLTDIGEFSVQPMANLPLAVIYDPDQNVFTPNWGDNNLEITPSIYYAGKAVALGSTGVTISWERQVGVAAKSALTTGETVSATGILSVTQNKFTAASTMLTYIVTAQYVEPTSNQTLTAQGQITFSLVRNASGAKVCQINGDTVFKYNSNQTLVSTASITLTSHLANVTISGWQYLNSNGTWTKYPGSGTTDYLVVSAADDVFVNDKCSIKLVTNDANTYDIHTIIKLRDGAAGGSTVSGVLTNDDQMVPFTTNGQSEIGDFSAAVSRIIIYEGGTDVTAQWTIQQAATDCTATPSTTTVANDTTAVTAMSAETANVTFTCTRSGYASIIKTFSVVKVRSGQDGVSPTIYSVEADSLALNRSITNVLTPADITFTAYYQTGINQKQVYTGGRFQIFENITLAEYDAASTKPAAAYTSQVNEGSHTYSPTTSASTVLCILYQGGGTTERYDSQMVVITKDGQTGQQGPQGEDGASAVNIVLGNYADVLTCTSANKLSANHTITIPFSAYEGTTRIPCTIVAASSQFLGVTPTVTQATSSSDGQIQWVLPANKEITTANGTISLTFTAQTSNGNINFVETYSWSRSTAARDGINAVILQIFTPEGTNVFNQDTTSITMRAMLTDGSDNVTTNVTWQWAKWTNGQYVNVANGTAATLTVQGETVDSYASYRCTAHYNDNDHYAYYSLFDKTDPIQVSVLCSLGTQIVNGQGSGAIYVKVVRNGQEIDALKSERFLTANPTGAKNGDYYYKIDETNKTVTLMKYTTSWAAATDTYDGTYTWTWRDKDGNAITAVGGNSLPVSGKVIYIDGDLIDGKIIADVEVEI